MDPVPPLTPLKGNMLERGVGGWVGGCYLGYSRAARVWSEGSDQRHGQEREEQRPDDVDQVVQDVGKSPLTGHTKTTDV